MYNKIYLYTKWGKTMKKNKILLTVFFALLITLFIITSAAPNVTGALKKTEILEYGGLQVSDKVTCYIIREEKVYLASRAGTIDYYIEEGQQARKGVKVLNVNADANSEGESKFAALLEPSAEAGVPYGIPSQNYITEFIGSISYYLDGYESILTPETMHTVDRKLVEDSKYKTVNVVSEGNPSTVTGDPLYKMIDDNSWYVLYWVSTEDMPKYEVGNDVSIELPLSKIKGKIESVTEDGDDWRIILNFNRYYEEFAQMRKVEATVITKDNKGLIVRNESIAVNDGQAGLYVKDKTGEFIFKPVKVISTDGEYSLVEVTYFIDKEGQKIDTVNVYDEILRKLS